MRRIGIYIAAMAAMVMLGLSSCGRSDAERRQAVEALAARVDSMVRTDQAPLAGSGAVADSASVVVTFAVSDSLVRADLLGEELFDYYAAEELRTLDGETLQGIVKGLKENDATMVVRVADVYGAERTFLLSADKLSRLAKGKRSQMSTPTVKDQVTAMLGASVPAPWAHPNTQVSCAIKNGFLTYTVTWTSKKYYADYGQGILTARYLEPLRTQYSGLGTIEYPVVDMLKSLGIDGVRMVYVTEGGDNELKQAFPWREIFR